MLFFKRKSAEDDSLKQKWVDDTPKVSLFKRLRDSKVVTAVWGVIVNTPIEIAIGAAIFGGWVGRMSYNHQSLKQGQIPVAFSEIEGTKKAFAKKGEPVPPLTMYYSTTNDIVMKVFEANNDAFSSGYGNEAFAKELQSRADARYAKHASIGQYAEAYRGYASAAFSSLARPMDAANRVDMARQTAEGVWSENHNNHYRTEFYTTTTGSGKDRRTVTRTRQVYVNTTHTYTYDGGSGQQLQRQLSDLAAKYPHLNLTETLRPAAATNEANQGAIRKSMSGLFAKSEPTAENYLELANRWATGSTFTKFYPDVRDNYGSVTRFAQQWQNAVSRAQSTSYTTYSRTDSGPAEFQVVESNKAEMEKLVKAMNEIASGIQLSAEKVPQLNDKIKEYIGVVLEGKPGDAKDLRSDIMSTARKIYDANFPGGFDVHPFKWGWVALFTVLGTLAGAGVGTGIDRYICHFTRQRVPEKESLKTAPVWRKK